MAFLAKAGKKVLLLERHNVPGGYASSFTRGRFEFEISLHELSGLGSEQDKGPLWRILNDCDVARRVEFIRIPEFYRSVFPDLDITIPVGRQNFEDVMTDQFPHQAEDIRRFSDIMFKFADEALRANRVGMKMVMQQQDEFPTLLANFGKTLAQVLNPIVTDEKARAVLGQVWGYYTLPPSTLSFLIYALGTASYLRFGPAHIKGKSQALSQAFVDAIEDYGGEVRLGNGVSRILVDAGKVRGVVTDDGEEILAPVVVSNANPVTACLELIGRDQVPSWYLKRLGASTPGASTFNIYCGVACDYRDLGLRNHENFVNTGYDLDEHAKLIRAGIGVEPAEAAVTAYNAVDPDFSPPGTSNIVITAIAYADPWLKLAPDKYVEAKNEVAAKFLRLAEMVAPDLRNHLEVVEVATPLTNARYTGTYGGSIIGFDENYAGTGIARMPGRGPLEGLYFTGAYTYIGGGYEPSIASGYLACKDVLKDLEAGGLQPAVMEKVRSQLEEQTGEAAEVQDTYTPRGRDILAHWHPSRVTLKVAEIIEETPSTKTLRMEAAAGDLPYFRAGQYVNLFLEIDGVLTSRPFSIASAPGVPYWDFTIRRMPGGFVSHFLLDRIKAGDVLESTGPNGSFYHEPLLDTGELVFLAGGSGITPFASIIREAAAGVAADERPLNLHLVYGSRNPGDIIFKDELDELAAGNENIRVDYVISEPPADWNGLCGLLDADTIKKLVGDVAGKTFFLCGPQALYSLCQNSLERLGVPGRSIRREAYGPPANVTREPGWPGVSPDSVFEVVEERSGKAARARAGEPLMNSLERAGIVVPAICRSGECNACRTRLVLGKVFAPARVQARWVDARAGYIHPCMSFPLTDLRIRI